MSCDIHICAEYWYNYELKQARARYWDHRATSICGNFNLGRNYALFNIMAGVRGDGISTVSLPRGIPQEPKCSDTTMENLSLVVVPDRNLNLKNYLFPKNVISNSEFEALKLHSSIEYIKFIDIGPEIKQCPVIFNPDCYSYSWLSLDELFEVRKRYLNEQIEQFDTDNINKKQLKEYKQILKQVQDPLQLFKHNLGPLEIPMFNCMLGMLFAAEKSDNDLKTRIVFWFNS